MSKIRPKDTVGSTKYKAAYEHILSARRETVSLDLHKGLGMNPELDEVLQHLDRAKLVLSQFCSTAITVQPTND